MKQPIVILQTSRLILRTTIEADIRHLQQRMFTDREVMRYALGGSPMADADSETFIRQSFTFGPAITGMATLIDASTEDVVGFAGLSPCDSLGAADFEIGFVLARHVWGKGLATEIGEAQLRFGFDQLGCVRLLGLVDPKNAISIRALKKLGMNYVKDVVKPGRSDRQVYNIAVDEWRKQG